MYCRFCGKEIEEDSLYCRYCGCKLSQTEDTKVNNSVRLVERFKRLSMTKQICTLVYGIWVLGWISYIFFANLTDEAIGFAIVYTAILPIATISVAHYGTIWYSNQKKKKIIQQNNNQIDYEDNKDADTWSLQEFVILNGKLKFCPADSEHKSRLACVNGDLITYIDKSDDLVDYGPEQISSHKHDLIIRKTDNETYRLEWKHGIYAPNQDEDLPF